MRRLALGIAVLASACRGPVQPSIDAAVPAPPLTGTWDLALYSRGAMVPVHRLPFVPDPEPILIGTLRLAPANENVVPGSARAATFAGTLAGRFTYGGADAHRFELLATAVVSSDAQVTITLKWPPRYAGPTIELVGAHVEGAIEGRSTMVHPELVVPGRFTLRRTGP